MSRRLVFAIVVALGLAAGLLMGGVVLRDEPSDSSSPTTTSVPSPTGPLSELLEGAAELRVNAETPVDGVVAGTATWDFGARRGQVAVGTDRKGPLAKYLADGEQIWVPVEMYAASAGVDPYEAGLDPEVLYALVTPDDSLTSAADITGLYPLVNPNMLPVAIDALASDWQQGRDRWTATFSREGVAEAFASDERFAALTEEDSRYEPLLELWSAAEVVVFSTGAGVSKITMDIPASAFEAAGITVDQVDGRVDALRLTLKVTQTDDDVVVEHPTEDQVIPVLELRDLLGTYTTVTSGADGGA